MIKFPLSNQNLPVSIMFYFFYIKENALPNQGVNRMFS